jgi:hypothetical protein
MTGHDKTKPDERETAITRQKDALKGSVDQGSIVEQYSDLTFSDLKAKAEEGVTGGTTADRPLVHFNLALYRSLRYSTAGGVYCMARGAVSGCRDLYEGQRLLHPLKQS